MESVGAGHLMAYIILPSQKVWYSQPATRSLCVNELKAVGPKLIVKEPVRNKPMSQKSEKKTCFEVVPVNII